MCCNKVVKLFEFAVCCPKVLSSVCPNLLQYLDDFITAGPPQSSQCAYNLNTAVSVCHRLGLPLHANKCVGPATSMAILGIELDSVNQVACLPEDKLLALRELIHSWMPCSLLLAH